MYLYASIGAAAFAAAITYYLTGRDLPRALQELTVASAVALFAFCMGQASESSATKDNLLRVCKPVNTQGVYICDLERENEPLTGSY